MHRWHSSNCRSWIVASLSVAIFAATSSVRAEDPKVALKGFSVVNQGTHLDMLYDGSLVTSYHKLSGTKPILWPLVSPKGNRLTRDYPMLDTTEGEKNDHVHHRSLWFTHGEVNKVDFWAEVGKDLNLGKVSVQEAEAVKGDGSAATINATANWVDKDEKVLLKERTSITLSKFETAYSLGYDISLTSLDQAVHFGDTKEGSFGIRVAEAIRVEAKKGGRILNSDGKENDAAWGQTANWVDYSGPVTTLTRTDSATSDSKSSSGVTIFYHPSSLRAPGRWHVRGYGLFAHNPFGVKDFVSDPNKPQESASAEASSAVGGYVMKPGETVRLRYSVLLHDSDWTPEFAERYWKQFSTQE